MLPAPLDLWDPVFRNMGMLGWSEPEVRQMEVWQVASWLGLGHDGARYEPVIRGERGLVLPKDDNDDTSAMAQDAQAWVNQVQGDERRAAFRRVDNPDG